MVTHAQIQDRAGTERPRSSHLPDPLEASRPVGPDRRRALRRRSRSSDGRAHNMLGRLGAAFAVGRMLSG